MSFMPKSDGELNPNNDASDRTSFEHEEEDEEEAARAKGADEAIGQMQALFVNNGANSVSFEQGEVAGQRPGAEDSNETTAVEEGSAAEDTVVPNAEDTAVQDSATANCCIDFKNGGFKMYLCQNATAVEEGSAAEDTVVPNAEDTAVQDSATANCCIDFKNGGFKMYLCQNAQKSEHECTFALCPDCYDDKNMTNARAGRATTSAYGGRLNKRARTAERDPKECRHDLVSLKTFEDKKDFTADRMDLIGVKMCVQCSRTIPPQLG